MALIQRIDIRDKTIDIQLSINHLCKLLQEGFNDCRVAENVSPKEQSFPLKVGFDLRRCGLGLRMLINGNSAGGKIEPDIKLIRLIAKAHRIKQKLTGNDKTGDNGLSLSDLAKQEGYSGSYATRLLRLAFLSPKIAMAGNRQISPLQLSCVIQNTLSTGSNSTRYSI